MVICAVFGCKSNSNKKLKRNRSSNLVSYYGFPKDEKLCKRWVKQTRRKDPVNIQTARICSNHFKETDFARDLKSELLKITPRYRKLKDSAYPTENLPRSKSFGKNKPIGKEEEFEQTTKEKFEPKNEIEETDNMLSDHYQSADENDGQTENCKQSDSSSMSDIHEGCKEENERLKLLISTLKNQLESAQQKLTCLESKLYNFERIFSPGQLRKMEKKGSGKIYWTLEDMSKAKAIHAAGPRAYRLLLKEEYPFPAVSTLRKWNNNSVTEDIEDFYNT